MMCERCADLEERIAYLEGELGLRQSLDELSALHRAFGLTRSEGRVVLALYAAKGRVMSLLQLDDALYVDRPDEDRELNIITVFICKARKKLPAASITNEWGKGYALTAPALAMLGALFSGTAPHVTAEDIAA